MNAVVPYRKPRQARGQDKFDRILDAAHSLIEERGVHEFGFNDVIARAGVAAGSAYHFFPNLEAVFVALVERYDERFTEISRREVPPDSVSTWRGIIEHIFEESRRFMNANPPALVLIIGPGRSWQSRVADTVGESHIARAIVDTLEQHFVLPTHPPPVQLMQLCIQVLAGIWELSAQRHGRVTAEFGRETTQVVSAYLRSYWPEYLDRVSPEQGVEEDSRDLEETRGELETGQ